MNTSIKKRELIEWLKTLQDDAVIDGLYSTKKKHSESGESKRKFGCGKNIFGHVSTDFNEPLL